MTLPPLRFSLLTLLTCVLLIGSAAALWWNWGPWTIVSTLTEDGPVQSAYFNKDDTKILTLHSVPAGLLHRKCVASLRDSKSGKIIQRWTGPAVLEKETENHYACLSPQGNYVMLFSYHPDDFHCCCWKLDTNASIDFYKVASPKRIEFSDDDRVAFLRGPDKAVLVTLPDLTVITTIAPCSPRFIDAKQAIFYWDEKVSVISTETGKVEWQMPIQNLKNPQLYVTQSRKLVIEETWRENPQTDEESGRTSIYDMATNKELFKADEIYIGDDEDENGFRIYTNGKDPSDGKTKVTIRRLNSAEEPIKIEGAEIDCVAAGYLSASQNGTLRVWSAKTGRLCWQSTEYDDLDCAQVHNSPYAITYLKEKPMRIVTIADGNVLLDFEKVPHPQFSTTSKTQAIWANDGVNFITYDSDHPQIHFWHKTRPEFWYGPACLLEFWLTTFLAAAFIWSLTRPAAPKRPN